MNQPYFSANGLLRIEIVLVWLYGYRDLIVTRKNHSNCCKMKQKSIKAVHVQQRLVKTRMKVDFAPAMHATPHVIWFQPRTEIIKNTPLGHTYVVSMFYNINWVVLGSVGTIVEVRFLFKTSGWIMTSGGMGFRLLELR